MPWIDAFQLTLVAELFVATIIIGKFSTFRQVFYCVFICNLVSHPAAWIALRSQSTWVHYGILELYIIVIEMCFFLRLKKNISSLQSVATILAMNIASFVLTFIV